MKTSININLPEDFTTLCTIYQINPETFIQAFIGEVSFPTFYSRPTATDRWATFFFLNLLRKVDVSIHVNQELEDEYVNKFNVALQSSFDTNGSDETIISLLLTNNNEYAYDSFIADKRQLYSDENKEFFYLEQSV